MNFLCPACRTPLPRMAPEHVTCSGCGVEVDLTRVDTAPGQARLWPEIDLSGETLSGHALIKLLGSGGMGSVYEARSPEGTLVALKVLSPLLAADPALRERFRREARALSALSHPGIVKMFGEGEERSFCWYAMERVHGVDLRERLKSGPLPVPEVMALGSTMLDALEVVHAAGFVHRDVKPSNILLSPEGPKLCDFGIARLEGAHTLTESAALLGSLRYMAPEQRWGKSDTRSDLYALGVVLHEALALGVPGERPLPSSTPAALARTIAKLTQANAVHRPQSASAAKQLLLASSRVPLLAAAAGLVLLATAGGAFALLELDGGTPQEAIAPVAATQFDAGNADADAGIIALAALEPPDAGEEPDAGLALAETLMDAGNPLLAAIGTGGIGPKPALAKGVPRGKPTKAVFPVKVTGDSSIGPLGTTEAPVTGGSKKKSKASEFLLGRLSVQGKGQATVFDGESVLGEAPGEFSLALGGHAVFVQCKVGEKRQGFKVMLGGKSASRTIAYECPER